MDKRYQVFISSTFTDLKEERQAVLKAILEIDHMPAGMELFPAADDSAWQLIKEVIDSSDYYVLIIGGRYGSLDSTGISYTEKEYDYAVASKKPVVPLLHKNPDNLPREKTEVDSDAWQKLSSFREKVEEKHTCVYWESADELKAKVIVGLTAATKRHPAVGWVRADQVPSGTSLTDILRLKDRVAELEAELRTAKTTPPPGTEDLYQGVDTFELNLAFRAVRPDLPDYSPARLSYNATINPTWNEIFAGVAPVLINEASEPDFRRAFDKSLSMYARQEFEEHKDLSELRLFGFTFRDHDIDTCIIQLRALGLIEESTKKRSVKDTSTYWTLTPYGDQVMVQLRALRRSEHEHKRVAGHAAPTDEENQT